jgi:type I restriction enzyme M protein
MGNKQVTVEELGSNLFECANELRGYVDKGEYKDYILPLVFYAEMNRRFKVEYEDKLLELGYEKGVENEVIDEQIRDIAAEEVAQGLYIPDGHSWESIMNAEGDLAGKIDDALEAFEEHPRNESQFSGVFEDDFKNVSSFTDDDGDGDEVLGSIIDIISEEIYDRDKDVELPPDTLGEAFMYLVERFSDAEAGEYFTPPRVTRLVVELLEPFEPESSFHDPTCGSGGMLIEATRQIRQRVESGWYSKEYGLSYDGNFREFLNSNGFRFSGQELNPTISGIAKMNLALNDITGRIEQGNSLKRPKFKDGSGKLQEFDYILANFPFSESGWKPDVKSVRQDNFGDLDWTDSLPHGNYGDFAFIMHMESQIKDDGSIATIIPHGVLFRNGDQPYREYMIENDMVEAVIGLPENLFEATGIPAAILVLNMDKKEKSKGEVMFFNADQEGRFYRDTGGNRNRLIDPIEDTDREVSDIPPYSEMKNPRGIAEIKQKFNRWEDEERVCRAVSVDEIRENEYNMNIALYVDTTEPQEDIDVRDTLASVRDIEHEYQQLNQQLTQYMQQLNYEDNHKGDENE